MEELCPSSALGCVGVAAIQGQLANMHVTKGAAWEGLATFFQDTDGVIGNGLSSLPLCELYLNIQELGIACI